jgi:hypothetical protein
MNKLAYDCCRFRQPTHKTLSQRAAFLEVQSPIVYLMRSVLAWLLVGQGDACIFYQGRGTGGILPMLFTGIGDVESGTDRSGCKSKSRCCIVSLSRSNQKENHAMLPSHNRKELYPSSPLTHQPAQISHGHHSPIIISKQRNSSLPILRLRVNVPSLNGNHSTLSRADRRLRARTSSR